MFVIPGIAKTLYLVVSTSSIDSRALKIELYAYELFLVLSVKFLFEKGSTSFKSNPS